MVKVDEFTTIRVRKATRDKIRAMMRRDEYLADVVDRLVGQYEEDRRG